MSPSQEKKKDISKKVAGFSTGHEGHLNPH